MGGVVLLFHSVCVQNRNGFREDLARLLFGHKKVRIDYSFKFKVNESKVQLELVLGLCSWDV